MSAETTIPTLLTVKQFAEKHPWPSQAGLRWLIFNSGSNGFSRCIVRCGRRVLVNEGEFFAWIDGQNPSMTAAQ